MRPTNKLLRDSIYYHPLFIIFGIALLLRLAFGFYFQQYYFGDFVFKYKDSASYLTPILNFINHGQYVGDFYLEDSKYFRVPIYPSFLGVIYSIFGANLFDYAVAFTQSILDSCSALLVYLILWKVTNSKSIAFVSGLIYATYPFIILWSPISYTEILQIFFIWILIYGVLVNHDKIKHVFFQGILVGLLILTKQYLGLTILIPFLTIILSSKIKALTNKIILLVTLILGMGVMLAPWTVRNYIESGKIIILKGESTGLRTRGTDFEAFEKFANLFNENITPMMNSIAYEGKAKFDRHLDFVSVHKDEIDAAVRKAYECGPSFMEIRMPTEIIMKPHYGCKEEVIHRFEQLTTSFWEEVPFLEAVSTRVDAVKKIFLKSNILYKKIEFSKVQLAKTLLFKYRVLLMVLGVVGIILLLTNIIKSTVRSTLVAILGTAVVFYIYFSLVIVHVEMRYLLVPDILLSIFASVPIVVMLRKFTRRYKKKEVIE